ncbi:MucBP domain-containing protein [Lentilactobacillus kisonensis]|uniref:MucBP domain-containing protein n=1 Tax=Lentilactobacillus kisonensis TaxID=481722 RepID=UPI0006D02604|nr:MucBP domain-containing protein [Lentilactobacillus kisonensis]
MGGTAAQHDTWLQKVVNLNWKGEEYAQEIGGDAKGTDSTTGNPYLDEWMPDKNLQKLILFDIQQYDEDIASVNDLTKNLLNQYETDFVVDINSQRDPDDSSYYNEVCNTRSLECFQYATGLSNIGLSSDSTANMLHFNTPYHVGALSDISALAESSKLRNLNLQMNSLYDISPLATKKLNVVTLAYNHIIDLSPLSSSLETILSGTSTGYQEYTMPVAHLNPNTNTFTTPSVVIKNPTGANVPIHPFYGVDNYYGKDQLFTSFNSSFEDSISTAYNDNSTPRPSVDWTNLSKNNTINDGVMTVSWHDPLFNNSAYTYDGVIIQPYVLDADVGNVQVNFKNGDTGQYLHPSVFLSGPLNDSWNLSLSEQNSFTLYTTKNNPSGENPNQNIQDIIDNLRDRYQFSQISVSSPTTGQYKADSAPTVTYTFSKKNVPVAVGPVTVHYRLNDINGETLAPDQTLPATGDTPASGDPFTTTNPTKFNDPYQIGDYKLDKIVSNGSQNVGDTTTGKYTGAYTSDAQTVTYVYSKKKRFP